MIDGKKTQRPARVLDQDRIGVAAADIGIGDEVRAGQVGEAYRVLADVHAGYQTVADAVRRAVVTADGGVIEGEAGNAVRADRKIIEVVQGHVAELHVR